MRTKLTFLALTVLVGCGKNNPCDDYVEAICDCNEAKCDEVQTTYENADADQQDVCSELLTDAKSGDDALCEDGGGDDSGDTGA